MKKESTQIAFAKLVLVSIVAAFAAMVLGSCNTLKKSYNKVADGYLSCVNYDNSNSIYNNTLGIGAFFNFSSSGTITQNIQNVFVNSNCIVSDDISAATTIYGNFSKTITKRQDGSLRLGYLNNLDVMVYVAVDA